MQQRIAKTANTKSIDVQITKYAKKSVKKAVRGNANLKKIINRAVEKLGRHPDAGVELTSDLYGFRSHIPDDKDYRIVYEYQDCGQVLIHAVGRRSSVYTELARFLKKVMPYQGRRG